MKKLAAEYNFKATGLNRGYAGEMHVADKSVGYMGADGIVGPAAVIAAGSAFAFRARGSKQVSVVFGGDGTYATPAFHSSLNNASLLKLPFIYVVENNLYHQFAHYSYSCPHEGHCDCREHVPNPRRRRGRPGRDAGLQQDERSGGACACRRGADPDRSEDLPLLRPLGRARSQSRSSSAPSATTRKQSPRGVRNGSCGIGCRETRSISAATL